MGVPRFLKPTWLHHRNHPVRRAPAVISESQQVGAHEPVEQNLKGDVAESSYGTRHDRVVSATTNTSLSTATHNIPPAQTTADAQESNVHVSRNASYLSVSDMAVESALRDKDIDVNSRPEEAPEQATQTILEQSNDLENRKLPRGRVKHITKGMEAKPTDAAEAIAAVMARPEHTSELR